MIGTYEDKIVNAYPSKDATDATVTTDIISLKNYDHITYIISFGVCSDTATTDGNLIAYKCETVSDAAVAFACKYRAELDATADTLGTLTTLSTDGEGIGHGHTLDITTGGGFIVVEIDAADLEPTIAAPYDTVKLSMDWASAQAAQMSIIAILSKGRYKNAVMPTAITD